MNESKSLEKNVGKIIKALKAMGCVNIESRILGQGSLLEGYTNIYSDFKDDLSIVMVAGGKGDNIAFGAKVLRGRGDFPSVDYAPIRGGKPEEIINKILERY